MSSILFMHLTRIRVAFLVDPFLVTIAIYWYSICPNVEKKFSILLYYLYGHAPVQKPLSQGLKDLQF